jgi:hypothetical protein
MRKRMILLGVMLLALAGSIGAYQLPAAAAQDPTIPTRTPTPDGSTLSAGSLDETVGPEVEQEIVATPVVSATPQSSSGALGLIVPLGGLALIGAGLVLVLVTRNRRKGDGGAG